MQTRVRNKKIDEEVFLKDREGVLSLWPTGREVNLEEAIAYQKTLPDYKDFGTVVDRLRKEGKTVVFPRGGTPILEQEIELNQTLLEAGLPCIPVTPDSYCRLGRYDKAQEGLEESIRTSKPKLNGYPTVIHGVKNTRKMTESTRVAFNQRLTNVGGVRLIAEIAFASGMTAALVDPVLTFASYEKNATPAECIKEYQYIFRLVGYYAERGVIFTTDFNGPHPMNLHFPQAIHTVGLITDALIAAEQGVKSIVLHSTMYGHMAQDVAQARIEQKLVREYLDKFGYNDVPIRGIFVDQVPLFPYPQDVGQCYGFTGYSAFVAALAEAQASYIRSTDEGAGIPSKEAAAESYRAGKWIFDVVRAQKIDLDTEQTRIEEKIIEMEARAIMDKTLELGDGDVAVGHDRAVQTGVIDYPLPVNNNCKGQVLSVRDLTGACRYLDFGNLPIPEEAKEFHREKIAEREKAEGRKMDFQAVVDDFFAFSKGKIVGRPAS